MESEIIFVKSKKEPKKKNDQETKQAIKPTCVCVSAWMCLCYFV